MRFTKKVSVWPVGLLSNIRAEGCIVKNGKVRITAPARVIRIYHECEGGINRIYHWCSVGTEKSQPEGHRSSWKRGLPSFPLNSGPEGWDFSGTTEHQ